MSREPDPPDAVDDAFDLIGFAVAVAMFVQWGWRGGVMYVCLGVALLLMLLVVDSTYGHGDWTRETRPAEMAGFVVFWPQSLMQLVRILANSDR